ncbi:MAG: hypothetical protein R8M45_01595, partial [Ghiorsea sp.]
LLGKPAHVRFDNEAEPKEVKFINGERGFKKFKHGIPHNRMKAKLLAAVRDILESGKIENSMPASKDDSKFESYYFITANINVGGELVKAGITVGKDHSGRYFYNLNHSGDKLWKLKEGHLKAKGKADPVLSDLKRSLSDDNINVNILSVDGNKGITTTQAENTLIGRFGIAVKRAIESGKVKVVQSVSGLPLGDTVVSIEQGNQIRGAYDGETGITYIVASNNDESTLPSVFLHEAGHAFFDSEKGRAVMALATKQIEAHRKLVRNSKGKLAEWIKAAHRAIPNDTNLDYRSEELLAYAIQQYEQGSVLPTSISRIVKKLFAELKAFIIRHSDKAYKMMT